MAVIVMRDQHDVTSTVADRIRTTGLLFRMIGLQHSRVAFGRTLAARACSRDAQALLKVGSLPLGAGQLKDHPAV